MAGQSAKLYLWCEVARLRVSLSSLEVEKLHVEDEGGIGRDEAGHAVGSVPEHGSN